MVIRRELVRFNEIMAYTNQLSQGLEGFENQLNTRFDSVAKVHEELRRELMEELRTTNDGLYRLKDNCGSLDSTDIILSKRIDDQRTDLLKLPILFDELRQAKTRILELERLYNYEDHMDEIHDVLDQQFVLQGDNPKPPQIKRRNNNNTDETRIKQLEE